MSHLTYWLCRLLELTIVILLAAMVVLVFGNVVARYGFNSGITLSEEVSRWLFIWMTFLGAIVALKERGHLGFDMVVSRLPPTGKRVCLIGGQVLLLYILWLLLKGSWEQAKINWDVTAPVTGAPIAIVYFSGVIFAIFAGIIVVSELYRAITGKLDDDELILVQESEESAVLSQSIGQAEILNNSDSKRKS